MKKTSLLGKVSLLSALLLPAAVFAQTVVSDCNLNGWKTYTEPTGTLAFVTGPANPPLGTGSVKFALGTDGNGKAALGYGAYAGTPLSSLTELRYSTYITSTGGGQAPALELLIDLNGDLIPEDRLVFEPLYQTGTYPGVIQNGGMVQLNTWQTWNVLTGGVWAASDPTNGPSTYTIASYLQRFPTARIINYPSTAINGYISPLAGTGGVLLTTGGGDTWNNFVGYADNLRIRVNGSTTAFDFDPCTPVAEEPKVTLCHKGKTITVGASAVDAHLRHGDKLGACGTQQARIQSYPNPFKSTTTIEFELSAPAKVVLQVSDVNGKDMRTIMQGEKAAGKHTTNFVANGYRPGTYYYILTVETPGEEKKVVQGQMVIIK